MGIRQQAHDFLKDKPLKLCMNILTIIVVLCIIGVILWGFFQDGFDALRVIVSIYLLCVCCQTLHIFLTLYSLLFPLFVVLVL